MIKTPVVVKTEEDFDGRPIALTCSGSKSVRKYDLYSGRRETH